MGLFSIFLSGPAMRRPHLKAAIQSFLNTIEAIQPVISAMKAVTRP